MATYDLFEGSPSVPASGDTQGFTSGNEFYVTSKVWATGIWFLQPNSSVSSSNRTAAIYTVNNSSGTSGTMVAGPFTIVTGSSASTWYGVTLPTPFELTPNQRYRVVVFHPNGRFARDPGFFTTSAREVSSGPLVRCSRSTASGGHQSSWNYVSSLSFPTTSSSGNNYYSDIVVTDDNPFGPTFSVVFPNGEERPATIEGVAVPGGSIRTATIEVQQP